MKARDLTIIALLIVIAALLGLIAWNTAATGNNVRRAAESNVQWEYSFLAPLDQELKPVLEKAGQEGWEIVSMRRAVNEATVPFYEITLRRRAPRPSR